MDEKKYYYSEIFHSIQGEGHYTGVPTAWIRFFLCNLQCNGFGQIDPTNSDTYELPFEDFDVDSVKRVEDLPVWEKGCDSSYTWAKKFKKLMGHETPTVLANKIVDTIKTDSNPEGTFLHPVTNQRQHLCITGGEPLMVTGQMAFIGIYQELERQNNLPGSITFETNGTQLLTEDCADTLVLWKAECPKREITFSVSAKLSASGETWEDAVKPEVVVGYERVGTTYLKFVVEKPNDLDEVDRAVKAYREAGFQGVVYIMPVGGVESVYDGNKFNIDVVAMLRGYYYSQSLHVELWGNTF